MPSIHYSHLHRHRVSLSGSPRPHQGAGTGHTVLQLGFRVFLLLPRLLTSPSVTSAQGGCCLVSTRFTGLCQHISTPLQGGNPPRMYKFACDPALVQCQLVGDASYVVGLA